MALAKDFIHKNVLVLREDTAANMAARAMCERHAGSAIVANKVGHIVGIVTDRDLACEILGLERHVETPLRDIMTMQIVTVDEQTTLKHVLQVMETFGVRRIPVVHHLANDRQKCVGIITLDDLISAKLIESDQLAKIVKSQVILTTRPKKIHHHEEKKEQKKTRFMKIMTEKLGLKKSFAEPITLYLLEMFVRRLPAAGAAHLISELPNLLQDDLLDLPAGPDRRITASSLIFDLEERFGLDEFGARNILQSFWEGLEELLDVGLIQHMSSQLPVALKRLLSEDLLPPETMLENPSGLRKERILTRE